jgi:membrane-associated phospholipid phosphatase
MTAARTRALRLGPALLSLLLAAPLGAQTPAAAAPSREDSEAWEWAAGGAAMGGALLLDGPIQRLASHSPERAAKRLTSLGNRLGHTTIYYEGFAALAAGGLIAGDGSLVHGTLRSATALAVNGVATALIKRLVGRARPDTPGSDGDEFHPLSPKNEWHSFPSRHTSTTFTLASLAAAELHEPVVTTLAYGTAALVGLSRIEANEHWASDVVAGAILGMELSQAMERWMGAPRGHDRDEAEDGVGPVVYLGLRIPVQ